MTHWRNYPLSHQEVIISDPAKITSYFTNKVDYDSMKVNIYSKTEIEELYEDGVPVLLESDYFKPFNKLRSPPVSHPYHQHYPNILVLSHCGGGP